MWIMQKALPSVDSNLNFSRVGLRGVGPDEGANRSDSLSRPGLGEARERIVTQEQVGVVLGEKILALYDEFRPRLLRYICSLNLNRDQAEDVIQETFLRLTAKMIKGRDDENIQGWIVRVSHNVAMDLLEKGNLAIDGSIIAEATLKQFVDPTPNPEEAYSTKEQARRMSTAVSTLNAQQRQCFELRARGFRHKDIALALGISEQRAAFVVRQAAVRLAKIVR